MGSFIVTLGAVGFFGFTIYCLISVALSDSKSLKDKIQLRNIVRVVTPISNTISHVVTKSLDGGKTIISTTVQKTIHGTKKDYFVKKSKKELNEEKKHREFRENVDSKNDKKIRKKYREDFDVFDKFE